MTFTSPVGDQPAIGTIPGSTHSPVADDHSTVGAEIEPSSPTAALESLLQRVDEALCRGDIAGAHRHAEALCQHGGENMQARWEGRVQLRLAYCDFELSRIDRARESARQAAALLKDSGDATEEVDALSLWSRASTRLGHGLEAVECAALAVRLAADLPPGLWAARAHLSLAIAYAWAGAAAQASQAFEAARQAASLHGRAGERLEVTVERLWAELAAWADSRRGEEPKPVFRPHLDIAGSIGSLAEEVSILPLTPGVGSNLSTSADLACRLAGVLGGKRSPSDEAEQDPASADSNRPATGWLLAAHAWLQAEEAVVAGALEAAEMHARRMTQWALDVHHVPLAWLGHRLAAAICIRQGHPERACVELEKLLAQERTLQVKLLEGRAETAGHLWALRQSESRIRELADSARKLEEWALTDSLTGIANRRRLTQCLDEWTAQAADTGEPLSVALMDVDRFKSINDGFSYNVGDAVLATIAQKMVAQVRDGDLAARWGGDEFFMLFRNTDLTAATAIAERVQEAVGEHDWSGIAPNLAVTISVGVVEARRGDDKASLVERGGKAMQARKRARERTELARTLPAPVLRRVAGWLRRAQSVVIVVGAGTSEAEFGSARSVNVAAWDVEKRSSFADVRGLQADPRGFGAFWRQWRIDQNGRQPLAIHRAAVTLSESLPNTLFVTERVDGSLAMAGARNIIELYGNAFRDRCGDCGAEWPGTLPPRCPSCGRAEPTMRPDIVLLGEMPDNRVLARAELAIKHADVVLVVDCDAVTHHVTTLLEKGRNRGAHIVMLGHGSRLHRGVADVSLAAPAEPMLKVLLDTLQQEEAPQSIEAGLSPEGFDALCFLTGHGTDNAGHSLAQALGWMNWEVEVHQATIPWMFPLTTRSRANPEAPMPTQDDFVAFSRDEHVRAGMRKAFLRMLRFYGFEWQDNGVKKSPTWRDGFATWALGPSAHDQFISRILESMRLCGLREEALSFLSALEPEVRTYRGDFALTPLRYWRLAVRHPSTR